MNKLYFWWGSTIHVSMELKVKEKRKRVAHYISVPPFIMGDKLFEYNMGQRTLRDDILLLGEPTEHLTISGLYEDKVGRWWGRLVFNETKFTRSNFNNISIIREALYRGCERKVEKPFIHSRSTSKAKRPPSGCWSG